MVPPVISVIREGNTGMIIPRPVTSIRSVTNMKPRAGFLDIVFGFYQK
jgi:hypothetical protein